MTAIDTNQVSRSGLLTPFSHKSLHLRNRFAMAPMTRVKSPGGTPTAETAEYYRARAAADVGLIITEGVFLDHRTTDAEPDVPRLSGEARQAGWRRVVDAVHAEGTAIIAQLWHTGLQGAKGVPDPAIETVGPSPVAAEEDRPAGRALTIPELTELTESYADAARNAQLAGFDGIEIHGAHGYLLDQFLWRQRNQRTDQYGVATRYPAEAVAAIREAVGPDFTIALRFSQWKAQDYAARIADNPYELAELLTPLVDAGVDILHASTRRFWEPAFPGLSGDDGRLGLSGWAKKITGRPTITVGSVGLPTTMLGEAHPGTENWADNLLDMFERDEFDLVAVGRALLADPRWLNSVGITPGQPVRSTT